MDINLLSAIIFYAVIVLLIIIFRKKFDIYYKIIALYKTKFGLKFMDRVASAFPRTVKVLGFVGIALGFAGMATILYFLVSSLIKIIFVPTAGPIFGLVLPGIKIPGAPIFVPFWYGIISIFIVALVHELAHGILARAYKIKVKSSGVGMFAIFPLAFVEPDEKVIAKRPARQQLSIFAAGPFANIVLAVIALLVISLFSPAGVEIMSVAEGMPAAIAGIEPGTIIAAVDGIPVMSSADFVQQLQNKTEFTISSAQKDYILKIEPSQKLGVQVAQHVSLKIKSRLYSMPFKILYLLQLLNWIFILSSGIGLANLIPIGPFDGGRMLLIAFSKFFKKKKNAAWLWSRISALSLILLILNLLYPYLKNLF